MAPKDKEPIRFLTPRKQHETILLSEHGSLEKILKRVGLMKDYSTFLDALDLLDQAKETIHHLPTGGFPFEQRLKLGYELQVHQTFEQFYRKAIAVINSGKYLKFDELLNIIVKTFITSTCRKWLIVSPDLGLIFPIAKDHLPRFGQLRQQYGENLTLGHVITSLTKEMNRGATAKPQMDHEVFIFFTDFLLSLLSIDPIEVLDFVRFATLQIPPTPDHSKKHDPLPADVAILGNAKDLKAWKESQNLSIFMMSFINKLKECLLDEDHPCHDEAVHFLVSIDEPRNDEESERGSLFSIQLMRSTLFQDLFVESGEITSFLRSIKRIIDNTAAEWAKKLYSIGEEFIEEEKSSIILGTTTAWSYRFHSNNDAPDTNDFRLLTEHSLKYIENSDLFFEANSETLPILGISPEQLGIMIEDEEKFRLKIVSNRKEQLLEVTLHFYSDNYVSTSRASFIIDYQTEPITLILDTIDPEGLSELPKLESTLLNLVFEFFLALNVYIRDSVTLDDLETEHTDKQSQPVVSEVRNALIGAKSKPSSDTDEPQSKKRNRHQPKTDEGNKKTTSSPLTTEVIARRNAPIIEISDDCYWDVSEKPARAQILKKITYYNKSLIEHAQITCDGKPFKADVVDPINGWKIWQIKAGDYRILCRVFPGNGKKSEAFLICNRRDVAKYIPSYHS